jgi:nitrate reductase NapA
VDVWEGYAAAKLMKAGFRSNNLDPNARHCMASAVAGFMRTFGMDEPMGCYDDIEQADAFVLWGSNMAEMHPILWTRITDRRLTHRTSGARAVHLRAPQLRAGRQRHDLHAPDRSGDPQLHLQLHHPERQGEQEFVKKHVNFRKGDRHRLRPASHHPLERPRTRQRRLHPDELRGVRQVRLGLHLEKVSKLSGVPKDKLEAGRAVCRPEKKVVSFWTMGFNQHTRGTWANNMIYNVHLLTGKISSRAQPVLADRPALRLRHRARSGHLRPPPAGRHGGHQPRAPRHAEKIWQAAGRHHPRSATTPCCRTACSRTASSMPTG